MLPRPRTLTSHVVRATAAVAIAAVVVSTPGLESKTRDRTTSKDQVALAAGGNPVTPGNFQGYGFDQCVTPTGDQMNAWLYSSPFLAAGVYISGKSRACRSQPNLTPDWVRNQLRNGWKLLPITLGPQASCNPRFPRYKDDRSIVSSPGSDGLYRAARNQGRAEADTAVAAAKRLGIVPRSTLWYDMEAFDIGNTRCRESALAFMSAWTTRLHSLDYVSGVYSSAASGIKALDDVRAKRPGKYVLPDQIWIARWDGKANTSTTYIPDKGWLPGRRMKQYRGGHQETWGGVTINIDSNYLDLGRGMYAPAESRCGGTPLNFRTYPRLRVPTRTTVPPVNQTRALQCLMREEGLYRGKLNGKYWKATRNATRIWQAENGHTKSNTWSAANWVDLLAGVERPALKFGSAGNDVRRVQRALNASGATKKISINGLYNSTTTAAVKSYQKKVGVKVTGIVDRPTWKKLQSGARS